MAMLNIGTLKTCRHNYPDCLFKTLSAGRAFRDVDMDEPIAATAPASDATPASPALSPAKPQSGWSPAHAMCAILVAILAFLLGSFRVNNPDIWLTLGTGKLLATGQYQF